MARSLFYLACAFGALAALSVYCSWRLLRAAFRSEANMPLRESAFGALTALAVLVNVLRTQAEKHRPEENHASTSAPSDPVETITLPPSEVTSDE
jgi:hypothetical protein